MKEFAAFPGLGFNARRRLSLFVLWTILGSGVILGICLADDLTTTNGKKFENVRDIKYYPDGVLFSYGSEGSPGRAKVLYREMSADFKKKYNYDPFEEGFYNAKNNKPIVLTLNHAFRLSNLEVAKQKAREQNKPIGFIMVWDSMFNQPAYPLGVASPNALAGFYTVFHEGMILVFVRHEEELDKVPDAVKLGFSGPEEGGMAPNMAVVTGDCSQFICEIPMGGHNSNGVLREQIFRKKLADIKKFLEKNKS